MLRALCVAVLIFLCSARGYPIAGNSALRTLSHRRAFVSMLNDRSVSPVMKMIVVNISSSSVNERQVTWIE